MSGPRNILCAALAIALSALAAAPALAAPVPAWSVQAMAAPTYFEPGDASGRDTYAVFITNSGAKTTDHSQITIVDTLPAGLGVKSVELRAARTGPGNPDILGAAACQTEVAGEISTVTCKVTDALFPAAEPAKLFPGDPLALTIHLSVPPTASGPLTNTVEVKGGGAAGPAFAESENQASDQEKAAAGFQEFHSELTDPAGQPASGAGSHPYLYSTSFAVNLDPAPPDSPTPFVPSGGDLRDIEVALPPGLAGNPTAAGRCSPEDFNDNHGNVPNFGGTGEPTNQCPDSSVVGMIVIQGFEGSPALYKLPLYNLIPPEGMPAQLGFQLLALPVYIDTRVRSEGDYGFTGYLSDITEAKRITAARTMLWGTPADPSHDPLRGTCVSRGGSCPANVPPRPFLRLPSSCADPLAFTMDFDTWAQPAAAASATVTAPAPQGCDLVPFDPALEAKPTSDVADAPAGLHFNLHIPQAENEDPEGLGEADLKDTTVTLPEGLLVNPASADGLEGCSPTQIGLGTPVGQGDAHFDSTPPSCPDASKLGKVTLRTPLVDHPLRGFVYLSDPFQNPFDSLLAIYIAVDDPQTGVVAKLAAKVTPDPATGQLTTTVKASPQVPFEDFELDFFEGARAPLRTPATCATHTTTSSLAPWSAPAFGPDATPSDSFQTTTSPSGGACPSAAAALPHAPRFEAGAQSPVAGAYSPFLIHLSRPDGSQELQGLNLTLPPGLSARLAGVAECSDAALASAEGKSGEQERASASCPSASHLGAVTVGAGAGPAPYYVGGDAYLAGPYRGAPLSVAIITPALAGPFDLGTVVVRAPLYIDPETAQGTVKSTFPTILEGIPLDIRSIAVAIDRPGFTLNPTSCEAKAVSGEAISVLGQSAPLHNGFQVGGCRELPFAPRLSLRFKGAISRGSNPKLIATLRAKPGEANVARAQVKLPPSAFLDNSHIKTICTRVQFAADTCPPGSVYGRARAASPLLDEPLSGPVYLRSSSHTLPDLVVKLKGPDTQPIEIDLVGRTDSVKGALRNTFEAVPDAPVSSFRLELFGGKRGLVEMSSGFCARPRAAIALRGQNGKTYETRPEVGAKCPKHAAHKRRKGHR